MEKALTILIKEGPLKPPRYCLGNIFINLNVIPVLRHPLDYFDAEEGMNFND